MQINGAPSDVSSLPGVPPVPNATMSERSRTDRCDLMWTLRLWILDEEIKTVKVLVE
jgi:hypothetical protein